MDDTLAIIFPSVGFDIYGAENGMTLAEVQEILGPAEVKNDWYGIPDHYAFSIEYVIGKSRYKFIAPYEMDAFTMLSIYWGRRRVTINYIESLFFLTKEEIIMRFGERTYGSDIVLGRKPEQVETSVDGYEKLYFPEWGLTFAFEDTAVAFISLDESLEVNRVGSGMTFFQIQTELGETEVYTKTKNTEDKCIEYSIEYIFNGFKYTFLSNKPGGNNSVLHIARVICPI